jgi:NAD-dependent dihydropyrimidine dehydrogenase PreA subunit
VYAEGSTLSARGYVVPVIKDVEKCVDRQRRPGEAKKCELCMYVCPDQAIAWENE